VKPSSRNIIISITLEVKQENHITYKGEVHLLDSACFMLELPNKLQQNVSLSEDMGHILF
jgi:hypothetical protein